MRQLLYAPTFEIEVQLGRSDLSTASWSSVGRIRREVEYCRRRMSKADPAAGLLVRKPSNSPALRIVLRASTGFTPLCASLPRPSPSTGSIPQARTRSSPSCNRIRRSLNRLSPSFKIEYLQCRRPAVDIVERANRLIQHQRNGGRCCTRCIGVPVIGIATAARKVRSRSDRAPRQSAFPGQTVEGAVSIQAKGSAIADCLSDRGRHARDQRRRVCRPLS